MTSAALTVCRASIATHSKSFSLASTLLSPSARDDTAAVYAFCRRADDAVDVVQARSPRDAVAILRNELDAIYRGGVPSDPALFAFQDVVHRRRIPRHYPDELLAGMAMDAEGTTYENLDALLVYCFRVAGTVGLMMSHVLAVENPTALRHAAHLGMAMQLTNVCRDVHEDWRLGRLYLPRTLLDEHGAPGLRARRTNPLPETARTPIAHTVRGLLGKADTLYASGERGIPFLPFRAAIAVRTARLVYADIGRVILRRGADPFAPRAVVSTPRKLALAVAAITETAFGPRRYDQGHGNAPFTVLGVHDVVPG